MIVFDSVTKAFGPKTILRGISFECPTGKSTVIIGPSGCGKSTTLKLLLRLIEADSGTVRLDDQDVGKLDRPGLDDFRRGIGIVFQSAALFDSLTVWENVGFPLIEGSKQSSTEIRRIADEKLEIVGLAGTGDLYPAELSGGMQKRVGFARAIVCNPAVMLYDEPTAGLDPVTSTVIEDLINTIRDTTGATGMVVTHQPTTIFRTADQIVMLHSGNVLATGSVDDFKNHADPAVRNFIEGRVDEVTTAK
ncbi:MAG: ATP-binding cassette domain-containing protein [Candidatus Sericytochromatia bacterium]|nr:ATP-binding cassette domain-containing protein [Candidatus Sericytochromatia bacterium]